MWPKFPSTHTCKAVLLGLLPTKRVMATKHGDIVKLSNEATGALVSLGDWLDQAEFKEVEGITICVQAEQLKEQAKEFLGIFAKQAGRV